MEQKFIVTKSQLKKLVKKAYNQDQAGLFIKTVSSQFDPISFTGEAKLAPILASCMVEIDKGVTPDQKKLKIGLNEFDTLFKLRLKHLTDAWQKINSIDFNSIQDANNLIKIKNAADIAKKELDTCMGVYTKSRKILQSLIG